MRGDVWRAVRLGLKRIGRHKKGVIFLYLVNLVVALSMLPGVLVSIDRSLETGEYRQKLSQNLDLEWLAIYQSTSASPLAETLSPMVSGAGPLVEHLERWLQFRFTDLPWILLAPAIFFWLAYSFVLGGALGSAALDPPGSTSREFFRTAAEFWGRFLRLGILSGTFFAGFTLFVVRPLQTEWAMRTGDWADGRIDAWGTLAGYSVLLILFSAFHLLITYARVITACEDRRSVLLAFFSGLRFCLTRPVSVLFLALLFLLLLGLWYSLGSGITALLPTDQLSGILGGVVISQLTFIGYVALRYWFYLSSMHLFQSSRKYTLESRDA